MFISGRAELLSPDHIRRWVDTKMTELLYYSNLYLQERSCIIFESIVAVYLQVDELTYCMSAGHFYLVDNTTIITSL